jgi:hypothetical protein
MSRKVIIVLPYKPCTHPAIEKRSDGNWYCTECGQRR